MWIIFLEVNSMALRNKVISWGGISHHATFAAIPWPSIVCLGKQLTIIQVEQHNF